MSLSQLNEIKNNVDPEVKELLLESASDAISSAKNLLDAVDTIINQLKSSEKDRVQMDLKFVDDNTAEEDNTVINIRESKVKKWKQSELILVELN